SAIEAGKLRRQEVDFDLPELLGRLRSLCLPQATAKQLRLCMDTDIVLPHALHGDPGHLLQVLLNLLQNAIKFTDSGEVALQVRQIERDGNVVWARFSVRDTGIGIPADARARIFEPFEQVDSGTARRYGGSGLGTTIAKMLVESMGGRIALEANPGGGSHFWFDVPLRVGQAGARADVAATGIDAAPAPTADAVPAEVLPAPAQAFAPVSANVIAFDDPFVRHRARVRPMQILIADDQPTNRVVLQRLLERAGHRLIFAEDGEGALDQLEIHSPDLMIIDLHMPGLSGFDVIRQARVMQAGRARTPIVVLSADATVEALQEAERAGAHAYLTKPVVVARLLDTIGKIAANEAPAVSAAAVEDARPGADYSVLQELAGMNLGAQFLEDFVEQCLRDLARSLPQIRKAAADGDWEEMREVAHAMRGVAENVGSVRLVERCRYIMDLASPSLALESAGLMRDLGLLVEDSAQVAQAQLTSLLAMPGAAREDARPGMPDRR
ncbi:MAG TPA: ATP-binding protein, partial [Luteimonas sp.]|nr:ATP-binding protein [Luteimonas sp.]